MNSIACDGLPLGDQDEPRTCHLVGCFSNVYWSGSLAVTGQTEQSLRFVLCKNTACRSATMLFQGDGRSSGQAVGTPDLRAECTAEPADASFAVQCNFIYDIAELADGDQYELTVLDPSTDTTLHHSTTVVTYKDHSPNGQGCPPKCRTGILDDSTRDQ
ncbi:MAG: hypothetical protein R3B13_16665 [Polyangiaceae bacterium]